jgi:CRISPR-associated protein Cas2
MESSFYIVSYDIEDDKRRNKVAKYLENFGTRVQYSVFEIVCSEKIIKEVILKIEEIINEKEDSLRIYFLCSKCLKNIILKGKGEVTKDIDVYVV